MSVIPARISHNSFHLQISLLCFVLGLLLAAAAFTATRGTRTNFNRTGFVSLGAAATTEATQENSKTLQAEVKSLQGEIASLRKKSQVSDNLLASSSDNEKKLKVLNQELNEVKLFAGLTDAVGPGVEVTLNDSVKKMPFSSEQSNLSIFIHDSDIASVVNELKGAGAEAIAINGQRVTVTSPIRCVGPVIQVNKVVVAPPIVIRALGDPDTLAAALNMQQGVLEGLRMTDPNMVKLEKKTKLHVAAFAGSTQMRAAKTAAPTSSDSVK